MPPPAAPRRHDAISYGEARIRMARRPLVGHPNHLSQYGVINPAHVTTTVRDIARRIMEARRGRVEDLGTNEEFLTGRNRVAPNHTEARAHLPVLADALQDAGVTDEPFLASLRSESIISSTRRDDVVRRLAQDSWDASPEAQAAAWNAHLRQYREQRELQTAHQSVVGKDSGLPVGYVVRRDGGHPTSGMRGNPPPGEIWHRDSYRSGGYYHAAQHKEGRPLTRDELLAIARQRRAAKKPPAPPAPPPPPSDPPIPMRRRRGLASPSSLKKARAAVRKFGRRGEPGPMPSHYEVTASTWSTPLRTLSRHASLGEALDTAHQHGQVESAKKHPLDRRSILTYAVYGDGSRRIVNFAETGGHHDAGQNFYTNEEYGGEAGRYQAAQALNTTERDRDRLLHYLATSTRLDPTGGQFGKKLHTALAARPELAETLNSIRRKALDDRDETGFGVYLDKLQDEGVPLDPYLERDVKQRIGAFHDKHDLPRLFRRNVRRFAKVDGHQEAHPLVAGFPVEHVLRHLANDPTNPSDIRDLSRLALTGKNYNGETVHPHGALWALHDSLWDHAHPASEWYNWMSAADALDTDHAVYRAMTNEANNHAMRMRHPHDHPRAKAEFTAHRADSSYKPGTGEEPPDQLKARLLQQASVFAPGLTREGLEKSLARHRARARYLFAKDNNVRPLEDILEKEAYAPLAPKTKHNPAKHADDRAARYGRIREALRKYALATRGDFIDGLRKATSSNYKKLSGAVHDLARRSGGNAVTLPAVYDSRRGAVPGSVQALYGDITPEVAHYIAASTGSMLNVPGMAVFHPRDSGPDYLHKFNEKDSALGIQQRLDRVGISERVFAVRPGDPVKAGFDVLIPDQGGRMRGAVQAYAQSMGLRLQSSPGYFKTIGNQNQAQARDQYRNTVVRSAGRMSRKGGPRRYSEASQETLHGLIRAAAENAHNHTPSDDAHHGAVADALEEVHGPHPLAGLIRRQFGVTGEPAPVHHWWNPPVGTHDPAEDWPTALIGRHGPFDLYLTHEPGGLANPPVWVVHATAHGLPHRLTYSFEFPHGQAHLVPEMFPGAAAHIRPDDLRSHEFGSVLRQQEGLEFEGRPPPEDAPTHMRRQTLTPAQVAKIRKVKGRLTQVELSKMYGVSQAEISRVKSGKRFPKGKKKYSRPTAEHLHGAISEGFPGVRRRGGGPDVEPMFPRPVGDGAPRPTGVSEVGDDGAATVRAFGRVLKIRPTAPNRVRMDFDWNDRPETPGMSGDTLPFLRGMTATAVALARRGFGIDVVAESDPADAARGGANRRARLYADLLRKAGLTMLGRAKSPGAIGEDDAEVWGIPGEEAKKYARPTSLESLLKAARVNPEATSLHGMIADALDETHPGHPVADLIRRQFGLGAHTEPLHNLWHDAFYAGYDGTHPYAAHLGSVGPFDLHLLHEGNPSANQRWVLRATSRLRGSRDAAYNFEFPHEEAHTIPRIAPGAAEHINPQDHTSHGDLSVDARNQEARDFDVAMDEQERNRD